MRKLSVFNSLTLDGVMQAPGRPDEDRRGGFAHGGWAMPYADPVMGQVMAEGMAGSGSLLLGRRTYEDFFSFWPGQTGNPISEVLDNTLKSWPRPHWPSRSNGGTPSCWPATPPTPWPPSRSSRATT